MTDISNSLLAEALHAHGGLDHWRSFKGQSSKVLTGGGLWAYKGQPLTRIHRIATSEFARQWTTVSHTGKPDWTLTWTPELLSIHNTAGDLIAERQDPRAAFAGHSHSTPWDPLHSCYFSGYALWTYHALPFILAKPGYEVEEIEPIVQDGQTLRGLSVRFPAEVHTHTREQRFYFGPDLLLRRHHYNVDVWADSPAVHFLSDYVEVQGIMLPTQRTVFVRNPDGTPNYNFNPVTIAQSDYKLF